jgi:F-box/WD-40 domain protein 7
MTVQKVNNAISTNKTKTKENKEESDNKANDPVKSGRRTMSESDVSITIAHQRDNFHLKPQKNCHQKRSHSLPHRYKIQNLTIMPSSTATKSIIRPCYSPQEFRRGLVAMRSWFDNLDDSQRTLAVQSIAPFLGSSQYHWLSDHLGPLNDLHFLCLDGCKDPLRSLPSLLTCKIIQYLDPPTLVRCRQVCTYWKNLFDSEWIWHRLCFLPRWRLSDNESDVQLERHRQNSHVISWRVVFRERYKLRRSWLSGQCHVRTFEGHSGGISCVQFDCGRIVSGSHDKTIRVWNIKTNSPWSVMTLTGHSGEVRCLHLEGNRLVSGSVDTTIKVWDLDIQPSYSSIGCRVTMVGHTNTVRCVQMSHDKGMVISGSYDETVKIWCLKTGRCQATLRGHHGRVLCMHVPWQAQPGLFLTGSDDKCIKVWSIDLKSCLKTLRGHGDAVTCISMEGNKVISGSLDRTIKLWNLESGLCLSTLDWMSSEGHTGVIRCLQADSWRIVSSSDDKTLKVWCLESGQRLVTLRYALKYLVHFKRKKKML